MFTTILDAYCERAWVGKIFPRPMVGLAPRRTPRKIFPRLEGVRALKDVL
jgi:hypothetical protein